MNSPELQPPTTRTGAMSVPSPRKQEKERALHISTQDPFCWADKHQVKLEERWSITLEISLTWGLRWYKKVYMV